MTGPEIVALGLAGALLTFVAAFGGKMSDLSRVGVALLIGASLTVAIARLLP
jgi:hypothetical protein